MDWSSRVSALVADFQNFSGPIYTDMGMSKNKKQLQDAEEERQKLGRFLHRIEKNLRDGQSSFPAEEMELMLDYVKRLEYELFEEAAIELTKELYGG